MFLPRRAPLAVRGVEMETPMQRRKYNHLGEGTPATCLCRRMVACRTLRLLTRERGARRLEVVGGGGALGFLNFSIEGGLYSETAMREAKSKNTVYSRHQGLSKQAT